jgi:hypothetical protein
VREKFTIVTREKKYIKKILGKQKAHERRENKKHQKIKII